jgi:hypothetical protein
MVSALVHQRYTRACPSLVVSARRVTRSGAPHEMAGEWPKLGAVRSRTSCPCGLLGPAATERHRSKQRPRWAIAQSQRKRRSGPARRRDPSNDVRTGRRSAPAYAAWRRNLGRSADHATNRGDCLRRIRRIRSCSRRRDPYSDEGGKRRCRLSHSPARAAGQSQETSRWQGEGTAVPARSSPACAVPRPWPSPFSPPVS